jgi:hemerythrin
MPELNWSPAISVNDKVIDDQHKKLFEILNQALLKKERGAGRDEMIDVLRELVNYSDYHFRTEDNYMLDNNYPLFQNHRREHGQYLRQLGVLIEAYEKSETGLPDQISAFLEQWLVRHVSESDLRYARYFKANQNNDNKLRGRP